MGGREGRWEEGRERGTDGRTVGGRKGRRVGVCVGGLKITKYAASVQAIKRDTIYYKSRWVVEKGRSYAEKGATEHQNKRRKVAACNHWGMSEVSFLNRPLRSVDRPAFPKQLFDARGCDGRVASQGMGGRVGGREHLEPSRARRRFGLPRKPRREQVKASAHSTGNRPLRQAGAYCHSMEESAASLRL